MSILIMLKMFSSALWTFSLLPLHILTHSPRKWLSCFLLPQICLHCLEFYIYGIIQYVFIVCLAFFSKHAVLRFICFVVCTHSSLHFITEQHGILQICHFYPCTYKKRFISYCPNSMAMSCSGLKQWLCGVKHPQQCCLVIFTNFVMDIQIFAVLSYYK